MSRPAPAALLLFALSCTGAEVPEEPPPPPPVEDERPCCTSEDIIRMHAVGRDEAALLEAVETTAQPFALTVNDIIRLSRAEVPAAVILKILEASAEPLQPTEEELLRMTQLGVPAAVLSALSPQPEPEPEEPVDPEPPPTLEMSADFVGGKRVIRLSNLSDTDYTDLQLTVNEEYTHHLKKLPAGSTDAIRVGAFKDSSGQELSLTGDHESIEVQASQGVWSHRF